MSTKDAIKVGIIVFAVSFMTGTLLAYIRSRTASR